MVFQGNFGTFYRSVTNTTREPVWLIISIFAPEQSKLKDGLTLTQYTYKSKGIPSPWNLKQTPVGVL